jgi:UDP-N-acetylglucosamine transferase subunit ALG13
MTDDAGGEPADSPVLLVTLGTDRHPFPRLLRWVGGWVADHQQWHVEVQHGASPAPRFGHAFADCGHAEIGALLRRAAVVVSHADPATITQAREFGHVPVVVARDPMLAEHVDDSQILFSRRLGAAGLIWLAESEAGLGRAINAALVVAASPADGDGHGVLPRASRVAPDVRDLVDTRRGQGDRGPRAPGRRPAWLRLRS